jgi:hypothetical protein
MNRWGVSVGVEDLGAELAALENMKQCVKHAQ